MSTAEGGFSTRPCWSGEVYAAIDCTASVARSTQMIVTSLLPEYTIENGGPWATLVLARRTDTVVT